MPATTIPDRGQATEDDAKPAREQGLDVFHDDVAGSKLANKSKVFEPKPAAVPNEAGAEAGKADVLAWEAAADDIHGNSICPQATCGEAPDVVVARDVRPPLPEGCSAVWRDFTERDGSHSGALKAEAKGSATAEKVEDIHPTFRGMGGVPDFKPM